ncbi:hypothetical protein [Rhodococcus sp. NPDC057529]|uniref:hypothetical protein n=1 Tax=Rhodococcus sp. NPDC057529 TaxID=3346158 RepID=UPI00366D4F9D
MESSAERDERVVDEALVAALTGDRREDYIEALLERAEVMKEFHVDGVRSCSRSIKPLGQLVRSPEEIRDETASLRRQLSSR